MDIATPYNGKVKKCSITFTDPSLTEQMYKDECDIGVIIENYVTKGITPHTPEMSYKDCTSVQDYQDAMYLVADCKSAFESLPAKERDNFKTVDAFLEFVSNPSNLKESYERGLINPDSVDLADVYPDLYKKSESVNPPTENSTVTATIENVAE